MNTINGIFDYILKAKGNYVEINIFRGKKFFIFISVFGQVN